MPALATDASIIALPPEWKAMIKSQELVLATCPHRVPTFDELSQLAQELQAKAPMDAGDVRRSQWFSSRLCLQAVLRDRTLPFTSLSHSPQVSMAVASSVATGVDLEKQDRPLSEALVRKIKFDDDLARISDIDLWAVKEALFKATPKKFQGVVADYRLTDQSHAIHLKAPHLKFRFAVSSFVPGHVAAIAFLD